MLFFHRMFYEQMNTIRLQSILDVSELIAIQNENYIEFYIHQRFLIRFVYF